jgi:hypothetical protein
METSTITPVREFLRETPSQVLGDRATVSQTDSCQVTACKFCHYFDTTGRRGGECNKLQSHVEGNWKACSLAMPIFVTEAIATEDIPFYLPPTVFPRLLPTMSPSMANILINSANAALHSSSRQLSHSVS